MRLQELPPIYRRATADDLMPICELGQEVNRLHHEAWPQIFAPSSDPGRDEAHWLQSILGEMAAAFVAEQGDIIVGFVSVQLIDEKSTLLQPARYARVGSVCVTPSMRGRGIGRHLMGQVESWAVANGAIDVRLNVWKFNAAALRLYEELGYEVRSLFMGKPL